MIGISIISQNFTPEAVGAASRLFEMAKVLSKRYKVKIICPPPTYPFTKYPRFKHISLKQKLDSIEILRIWTYQPTSERPKLFRRLLYFLSFPVLSSVFMLKYMYDSPIVIISIPPSTLLISFFLLKLLRKRIIIDVRDLWIDAAVSLSYIKEDSIMVRVTRAVEGYCLRRAELIITNSKIIQQTLVEKFTSGFGVPVEYYPFSVDSSLFKYQPALERKRQIIYVGNFGSAQNIKVLLRAVPKIIQTNPEIKIKLVGGGECEEHLRQLCREMKIEEFVVFQDPIPREQVPYLLNQSLLGIIPLADNKELWYAVPSKTFEYFACGLPVVAYGASEELERIMNESNAGVYVRGNDESKIADAIINLLRNAELLEELSKNGIKFAEERGFFELTVDAKTYELKLTGKKSHVSSL